MTKKTRKVLALVCSAILLVAIAVGATVAYLTSNDSVVNTFTVGDVKINLDETKVDENGVPVDPAARTETGNAYHLLPGHEYIKDPTVTVLENSEACYVRILISVDKIQQLKDAIPKTAYETYYKDDLFLLQRLVDWNSADWKSYGYSEKDGVGVYEFRYKEVVPATGSSDNELNPLFTKITVPSFLDNTALAEIQNLSITAKAEAIQADGFDTADLAWASYTEPTT